MVQINAPIYSLNSGEIDPKIIHRADLEKLKFAAETMENFIPEVMGPMSLRPGMKYAGTTYNNQNARLLPFVFNASTTALLELTSGKLRILDDGAPLFLPGGSLPSASGWSLVNDTVPGIAGATITNAQSGPFSYFKWKNSNARLSNTLGVVGGVTYTAKFTISFGEALFYVGRTSGDEDVLSPQLLGVGTHYISFVVPAGVTQVFASFGIPADRVTSIGVPSFSWVRAQEIVLDTPWSEADLPNIRFAQSASVMFIACKGRQPMKIERRGTYSWGLSYYLTTAGPYLPYNTRNIALSVSTNVGNGVLSSNAPFFKPSMVGSLFELTLSGQRRMEALMVAGQSTEPIKVTGVGGRDGYSRAFNYDLTYSSGASGAVQLEWSYGTPDNWARAYGERTTEVASASGTYGADDAVLRAVDNNTTVVESNDNAIVYYRLTALPGSDGFLGAPTGFAGPVFAQLRSNGGTQVGLVRVTGYNSPTSVGVEIIKECSAYNTFTTDWRQGMWSNDKTWPSAVALHDGRLWWADRDMVCGSVSDDFYNFDPDYEGDAGPIIRSIATGAAEGLTWILSLQRLIVGSPSAETSIRSSSFDQPLTPTAFTARNASTFGCANLPAVAVDSSAVFVQRNTKKVFLMGYSVEVSDYASTELTRVNQGICSPGVVALAVQRQPDTRIWFVKSDGTAVGLVYDRNDSVAAWFRVKTDGLIKDVCVLPDANEDNVFFVVNRNGANNIERLSNTADAGNWRMDCAVSWSTGQTAFALRGKSIIGWANGKRVIGTVSNTGAVTLPAGVTSAIIGLPYTAKFKSVKLAYGAERGTALLQRKRVDHLGFILSNTALGGVRFGRDFNNLTSISSIVKGKAVDPDTTIENYDVDATTFNGVWDTDARVCITGVAPYPVTVSGLVIGMTTHERP